MLTGETIKSGASETCSDCGATVELDIHKSAAGYYIGAYCACGPYSRESGYYTTRDLAQTALAAGGYERRASAGDAPTFDPEWRVAAHQPEQEPRGVGGFYVRAASADEARFAFEANRLRCPGEIITVERWKEPNE